MSYNNILVVCDQNGAGPDVVDFLAEVVGRVPGAQITLLGLHEKLPRHELPTEKQEGYLDKLGQKLSTMEIEIEQAKNEMTTAKAELVKRGLQDKNITIKFEEHAHGGTKDLVEIVERGAFGIVVVGRSKEKSAMFYAGGKIKDILSDLKNAAVVAV